MPTLHIDPVWLVMPALVIGAFIGYRRGWRREAITAVALALAIALLWNGPGLLTGIINGVAARLGRVMRAIVGGEPRSDGILLDVSPAAEPVVTLVLLAGLVLVAYILGHWLGRGEVDRAGRWCGAVIGGLALFAVMSRVLGTVNQLGSTTVVTTGASVRIPSFPGLVISVPPPPDQSLLVQWPLAALVVLVVSVMVYALLRMARA